MHSRQLLSFFGVLFVSYIVWNSTYFITRIGVESWPLLMATGVRFLTAGILPLAFLLLYEHKLPPLRLLLNTALVDPLLSATGSGMVTVAEHQNVPSGVAAVVIATVPLFTLCFSRPFDIKARRPEWVDIAIGLAGIAMLNSGGNLSGNPWGVILISTGPVSWAFGSVYGSRITLPVRMMTGAIEMPAADVVLMIASMTVGEKLTALLSLSGSLAVSYLAPLGSITAISACMYLIRNVSPALATSYIYVNPVIAVLLGTGLGGETPSKVEWLASDVIVFAVVLVMSGKYLFPVKPVVAPVIQDASSE